jgi:hypothetical protein
VTGRRRHGRGVFVAILLLLAAPILLYLVSPVARITAAFGSGAIVMIVLAHFGVFAVVLAPFLWWHRRSGRRQ